MIMSSRNICNSIYFTALSVISCYIQVKVEDKNKDTVSADESQTHCPISGEKFEIYWDDKLEEWRYKSAVKVDASQARR
jgi:hypothetical protein